MLLSGSAALAQAPGAAQPSAQEKLNPLAFEINVPATLTFGFGATTENEPTTLLIQPRIPIALSDNWRVVTRTDVPGLHAAAPIATTELGDIDVAAFVTSAHTAKWAWGAGPILRFPSATRAAFGTGKWCVGPTGALVYVDGPWLNGLLVSHLRSVAGASNRDAVNLTQVEIQFSYTFDPWYIQTAPTFAYDWNAPLRDRWVVPFGVDVGRSFTMAGQQLSIQAGTYYSVERPNGSPGWALSVQVAWVR